MIERELKLHVPADFVIPSLDGIAQLRADPGHREVQESTYWDTADCRLLVHGVGLRWRSDSGWTRKSTLGAPDGDLLRREEHTVAGPPEVPPGELTHPLDRLLAGLPLEPTVRIATTRTTSELRSPEGRSRVELVDDRVQVLDGPRRGHVWRELELELRGAGPNAEPGGGDPSGSADERVLAELASRLREAGAGPVVRIPKQLRALGVETEAAAGSPEAYRLAGRVAVRLQSGSTRAAGGVVLRGHPDQHGARVLVVHRPRYDDWCLPKGKQDAAETLENTAVREVEEETGLRCQVEMALGCVAHRLPERATKTVWWWTMRVLGGEVRASEETDRVVWLSLDAALARLSHAGERELLQRLSATLTS